MKNFGFNNLVLFNPLCNWNDSQAFKFAMHGNDILESIRIVQCEFEEEIPKLKDLLQEFDIVIGTSAKGLDFKNIKRIPVLVDNLDFTTISANTNIAVVFGRESTGLTNDQLLLTDFSIKIPANPEYPTMNLSHACGIILFTLFKKITKDIDNGIVLSASKEQKDRFFMCLQEILPRTPVRDYKYDRTFEAFKNVLGRAFISQKEMNLIHTFFKKLDIVLPKEYIADKDKEKELA